MTDTMTDGEARLRHWLIALALADAEARAARRATPAFDRFWQGRAGVSTLAPIAGMAR